MIAGYVDLDHGLLALLFFEKMRLQSMMPNVMALSSALKACASVGAVIQGQWLHDHIIRESLENDLVIGSGLVDMYGKCGSFVDASKIFDKLKCKDAAAWGTVISAFSRMGNLPLVRECLQTMQEQGLRPDRSIYSCILSAFSLTGQVNEGSTQFMSMLEDKAIITTADHFISMAHLLGCSGQLLKARELIECMPTVPDVVSQTSLLASCISYGNMHMAGESFQQLVSQHPNLAVSYLLMSNAYAGFGRGNHFEEQ
jgi:pentatricopeptide repeat protein